MVVVDTVALYFWNLSTYYLTYLGIAMGDLNIAICRASTFIQGSSLQSSAFLLVAIAIERYLSVVIKNWRSVIFKSKHAVITSVAIISLIFCGNVYLVGTLPYIIKSNSSILGDCTNTNEYIQWHIVRFCFFYKLL